MFTQLSTSELLNLELRLHHAAKYFSAGTHRRATEWQRQAYDASIEMSVLSGEVADQRVWNFRHM